MALSEYEVPGANGGRITVKLDEDGAKRYGDSAKPVRRKAAEPGEKAAPKPANKSRTASNK